MNGVKAYRLMLKRHFIIMKKRKIIIIWGECMSKVSVQSRICKKRLNAIQVSDFEC